MLREFKTIEELCDYFKNEEICREYLMEYRWNGVPTCPFCNCTGHYVLKARQYHCKSCFKNYSVKVKTIFDNTKVPLRKWYIAMWHMLADSRSMSSAHTARVTGVSQRTAWHMNHRIRLMFVGEDRVFTGNVQVDEVYLGGKKQKVSKKRKAKMEQGSGVVGKQPVVGIAETATGRKKYIVVESASVVGLRNILDENVTKDSVLVTDASNLYTNTGKLYAEHVVLNHSIPEFGRDGHHTNDIEGSFKHFRDNLECTFKGMVSTWHMQKYANEYTFVKNMKPKKRKGVIVPGTIITADNLKRVLRYRDLVILNPNHASRWDAA